MKLIWYPAATLDGFIATPDGRADWISPHDDRQFAGLVKESGAIVVGRRTFAQYHAHGNPFPHAKTYVYTRDMRLTSDDPAIIYVSGSPLELMRRLHLEGHIQAVLPGGGDTAGLFARANLIDEAWISVYPLMIGTGIPLLGNFPSSLRLEHQSSHAMPGGITHHRYQVG